MKTFESRPLEVNSVEKRIGKIRVMVVDDHSLFRSSLSEILDDHPDIHVVAQAENGRVAVELYPQVKPDVVIMDLHMPEMSGVQAAQRIHRLDAEAPILVLTVSDADEALADAMEAGASGYLLKSVAPRCVVQSVLQVSSGNVVYPNIWLARTTHTFDEGFSRS